jgi:hypothetical protein
MKPRQQIPANRFNPDQLVQLINALDQHRPEAWMITDDPNDDDGWTDEYRYVMRNDMEAMLAQTALPFALAQLEWLNRAGRRLN